MFFLKGFHTGNVLMSYFPSKSLPVNMKLLLTAVKITPEVNNYLLLVHAVQELRSSLHVRRSIWCLIMTSTKLK